MGFSACSGLIGAVISRVPLFGTTALGADDIIGAALSLSLCLCPCAQRPWQICNPIDEPYVSFPFDSLVSLFFPLSLQPLSIRRQLHVHLDSLLFFLSPAMPSYNKSWLWALVLSLVVACALAAPQQVSSSLDTLSLEELEEQLQVS